LLAEGFAANPAAFIPLQQRLGFSSADTAEACLCSQRQARYWRSVKPDRLATRYLAILAGYLPWDGWQGWEMDRGILFPPGYRTGGIPPGEFFAVVFYRQQLGALRRENQALRDRIEALEGMPSCESL
jgi:hypothetical protein